MISCRNRLFIELIHFLNGFKILIASFHDIKIIKKFVQFSKVVSVPTLFIVRRESAQRAAHIDVNKDYSIEDHYQTCIRLARIIDTDTSTGTPNLREPDTALAATIGQQLKKTGRGGKGPCL